MFNHAQFIAYLSPERAADAAGTSQSIFGVTSTVPNIKTLFVILLVAVSVPKQRTKVSIPFFASNEVQLVYAPALTPPSALRMPVTKRSAPISFCIR